MFYVVTRIDRLLGYTLRGMARTVSSPIKDPSMSLQTLLLTKNEVCILKKKINYDSEVDVPADTARRDYMEFVVEKVLSHSGDKKKPTTMSFKVKWLNYDDTHNSWEPWKNLRLCEALHEYLRDNKMKHFIPKNLEASVYED